VGAPGGCPTNNLYEVAIYSPQSHHDTVGSAVTIYMMEAKIPIIQPRELLINL
jgi:hypothetical protein